MKGREVTDQDLQKRIYDMLFEMHQEWPMFKGHLIRLDSDVKGLSTRVSRLELDQTEHRTKLASISDEWEDAAEEAKALRAKEEAAKAERSKALAGTVLKVIGALLISGATWTASQLYGGCKSHAAEAAPTAPQAQ